MKARIRHRAVVHPLTEGDRDRGYTDDLRVGTVTVTFTRAADLAPFVDLFAGVNACEVHQDGARTIRFNCDPGKAHRLAQTVGAIIARLDAIAQAEDDIDSLIKGRGGVAKIAW